MIDGYVIAVVQSDGRKVVMAGQDLRSVMDSVTEQMTNESAKKDACKALGPILDGRIDLTVGYSKTISKGAALTVYATKIII